MKNNPHLGSDVLAFLDKIIPDIPETRRVEQQELFRLGLTQALRDIRNRAGINQEQLAQRLDVESSWVYQLENANSDRSIDSVIAYLDALGAKLEISLVLGEEVISINPMGTPLDSKLDTPKPAAAPTNRGE